MTERDRTILFDESGEPGRDYTRLTDPLTARPSGFDRYRILLVLIVLICLSILVRTAYLQLTDEAVFGASVTVGSPNQVRIPAPRGEIVDQAGTPLAWSVEEPVLLLGHAGLEPLQLNRMLLDLSDLLLANGITYRGKLTDYLDLSQESKDNPENLDARFVFKQDWPVISEWQQKKDLFNLKPADGEQKARDQARAVRTDPNDFFEYLLYDLFRIEERGVADSRRYSDLEAFRIMELRYTMLENNWTFRMGQPVEIATGISQQLIDTINDQNERYAGALISHTSQRRYADETKYLSHVLGYIGNISEREYANLRTFGYTAADTIGKSGVESSAERYLRGQDGQRPYNIWTRDGTAGQFYPLDLGREAIPGAQVRLTLDLELQKTAIDAMQRSMKKMQDGIGARQTKYKAGAAAAVMLDVRTGRVLAMASLPGFQPADFLNQRHDPKAAERIAAWLGDTAGKPMLNRALAENYAPGSTFKPFSTLAALETGAITATKNVYRCNGHETIGGWNWTCLEEPVHGHGNLTLQRALITSCNLYFYKMGIDTGIDNISAWAKRFGFGELSGIDLPGEIRGVRPSRESKRLLRRNPEDQIWFPADTCQTAIGQFDNSYSILQLARATAALASGELVTPHVIQEIRSTNGSILRPEQINNVPLGMADANRAAIREGMVGLTRTPGSLTHQLFSGFPVQVAAKTGTAQTGVGPTASQNGVYICYAPADAPEVAIATIVVDGAYGDTSADISHALLEKYFALKEAGSIE